MVKWKQYHKNARKKQSKKNFMRTKFWQSLLLINSEKTKNLKMSYNYNLYCVLIQKKIYIFFLIYFWNLFIEINLNFNTPKKKFLK